MLSCEKMYKLPLVQQIQKSGWKNYTKFVKANGQTRKCSYKKFTQDFKKRFMSRCKSKLNETRKRK